VASAKLAALRQQTPANRPVVRFRLDADVGIIIYMPKKGSPAYVLGLIEPLRPNVDRAILCFV